MRPFADASRIAADPDYGRIVCHCERVTRGEIRDASRPRSHPPISTGSAAAPESSWAAAKASTASVT